MSHRLTASPPSGTASRLPLALCHGSATAQTARLATGIASRRNRRWYNWIFCFSLGAADPRNHDSARTHASVQICFGVRSWIDQRDASLQRNRRGASCCRAVSHVGGGCTGRAQSTALVSSFDRAMLMDQHLGHSDGPDHRCGLVLTFLLRSKCNQGRATVRIQWSLGQQTGRHCGRGCLSDPDVMGLLFSSRSNSHGCSFPTERSRYQSFIQC